MNNRELSLLLDQLTESHDEDQILAETAVKLQRYTSDLVSAWTEAYQAVRSFPGDSPEEVNARYLVLVPNVLKRLASGDVCGFYQWAAEQGKTLPVSFTYLELILLLNSHLRGALVIVARSYQSGPELELAVSALDELRAGLVTLLGAVFAQTLESRLSN